jgi:hypothetical protein
VPWIIAHRIADLGAATLIAPQPRAAHSGTQFPELGLLLSGDAQGLAMQFPGGFGTFEPSYFGCAAAADQLIIDTLSDREARE